MHLCFLIAAYCFVSFHTEHTEYTRRLANDDVSVVQGYVEKFQHQEPYKNGSRDRFEINGVYFECSRTVRFGYQTPSAYGGVITGNGQHLKIKYVVKDDGDERENIILYIAEIDP